MEELTYNDGQQTIKEMTLSDLRVAGWNAFLIDDETTLSSVSHEVDSRLDAMGTELGLEYTGYAALSSYLRRDIRRLRSYRSRQ